MITISGVTASESSGAACADDRRVGFAVSPGWLIGGSVGMVVSEMIASRAALLDNHTPCAGEFFDPAEFPFAIQLAGCDPAVMAEAAET